MSYLRAKIFTLNLMFEIQTMTKLILKIFFILPVWFLKLITLKKRILVNGQILDYQTQILLALQSLETNLLNLTESAESIREKLDGRKDALPALSSLDHR